MRAVRGLAFSATLASFATLPAYAQAPQPIKMMVQNIQMTPTGHGYYDAIVWINMNPNSPSPTRPVFTPYFQVQVTHVRSPEEATANLYPPISKYLTELQEAAEDLKHPPSVTQTH
jgi:hypothetical protein